MRRDHLALARERAVCADVIEDRHLVGANRQRRRIDQRRADAHVARGLDDLDAAGLGVAVAERERQPDRDRVDRLGDGGEQGDRAGIGPAVVLRTPVAETNGRVDHDGGRLEPVLQRRRIDIRLERRARLPQRIGRAVELARAVIAAADHGADRAVRHVRHHRAGLFDVIILPELPQRILDRVFRDLLDVAVEAGADDEHALGHRFRERIDQLLHLVEGVVEIIVRRPLVAAVDHARGIAPRAEHLTLGHEPGFDQIVEHHVGAGARGRQVDVRRELGRRLEQAGEHRRFGEVHVARRLVEIELRRRVDAERAAAHVGAVKVELQDVPLGEARFEPEGEKELLELAVERALEGEKEVLGELLGERRAALHGLARPDVLHEGARGAEEVDAEVLEEAPVFGGEGRLDHVVGDFLERHGVIVQDAALADLAPLAVEELHAVAARREDLALVHFLEGGNGERVHEDEAAAGERQSLRHQLIGDLAPSIETETREEARRGVPAILEGFPGIREARVDPTVETQPVDAAPPPLPLPAEPVAQRNPQDDPRARIPAGRRSNLEHSARFWR